MKNIKKIITALLNNKINEELNKDSEIQVLSEDILYQDAVRELLNENNDVDFLLLNENLPGEEIESFIEKINNTKIIVFTENNKRKQSYEEKGVYKVYKNGEIRIDEIKDLIKETNYTEELEKEINRLKKIIEDNNKKVKLPNLTFPRIIKKRNKEKIKENEKVFEEVKKIPKKIKIEFTIKLE